MASFAQNATVLRHLRMFVSTVYTKLSEPPVHFTTTTTTRRQGYTRTLEAFADAVDREIQAFDTWCANKEEQICCAQGGVGPALTVSLLSLEKDIKDTFTASFSVVLDVLQKVMGQASGTPSSHSLLPLWRIPPAAVTTLLLDTLLQAVQEHLSMIDMKTANTLMRVFAMTAEPVWSMVGRWLEHGMPIHDSATTSMLGRRGDTLDDEFFIEDNEIMFLDPDFWSDGYILREGTAEVESVTEACGENEPKTVPVFLAHVAGAVLSSGKATGLLRALGVPPVPHTHGPHRSFGDLLALHTTHNSDRHQQDTTAVSLSADTLSRVVYDELLPRCRTTETLLTTVLADDCDLWRHLSAIENLYLMRRGDTMSHFTDVLFAKVCPPHTSFWYL